MVSPMRMITLPEVVPIGKVVLERVDTVSSTDTGLDMVCLSGSSSYWKADDPSLFALRKWKG